MAKEEMKKERRQGRKKDKEKHCDIYWYTNCRISCLQGC